MIGEVLFIKQTVHYLYYHLVIGLDFLLSSDIRSEGSIAIVKKFDFDFMIFDSTSLPQSKNVF